MQPNNMLAVQDEENYFPLICQECNIKEIKAIILESKLNKKSKEKIINELQKFSFKNIGFENDSCCAICKNKFSKRDTYYMFFYVFDILTKKGIPNNEVESLLEGFNYQHIMRSVKKGEEIF